MRRVDVPIAGLPAALHGFTIAQISDVHVGPTIKRDYVDAIVDAVNDLDADMIAVTGDLVDGSVAAARAAHRSRCRGSPRGTAPSSSPATTSTTRARTPGSRRCAASGSPCSMNEHVVLEHDGAAVVVAGVTDYRRAPFRSRATQRSRRRARRRPGDAGVRLLLAHQPRSAFAAAPAGFDLQLSGHTHGGQFLPWNFLVRLQQPFTAGLHRLGKLWVYISRGTGYWGPPKRLGAPSEITYPAAGAGVAVFSYLQSRIRGTAATGPGAPPPGLIAFYWHFARQTKGWYALMFVTSLAVALIDTVIPVFIGKLVSLMEATDRQAALDAAVAAARRHGRAGADRAPAGDCSSTSRSATTR